MARLTVAPPCANPGCYLPRRHRSECDRQEGPDACRGCLPAQSAPGLRLCDRCARCDDPLKCSGCLVHDPLTAAKLHRALAVQLRRAGRGEHTSGSRDRSPGVDASVLETRAQIVGTLRRLAKLIQVSRGFSVPGRWVIHRRPTGFIGPLQRHRYADTSVEALSALVSTSAEWLAAHPDAGQHAADLRAISHGRVWGLAYPSGPKSIYIGQCPLMVTFIIEDADGKQQLTPGRCDERLDWDGKTALITCPGCETAETVEWWQREIVGETGGVVDAQMAASWLSLHWYRDVRPSVILNWASRAKVARLMAEPERPGAEPKPRRDERGHVLFSLVDVKACAEKTWGLQPKLGARRKVGV